jgi:hypothetical protein
MPHHRGVSDPDAEAYKQQDCSVLQCARSLADEGLSEMESASRTEVRWLIRRCNRHPIYLLSGFTVATSRPRVRAGRVLHPAAIAARQLLKIATRFPGAMPEGHARSNAERDKPDGIDR